MPEQLLSIKEVAKRLAVSRRQFYYLLPELQQQGLRRILVGGGVRFRESDVDRWIKGNPERLT